MSNCGGRPGGGHDAADLRDGIGGARTIGWERVAAAMDDQGEKALRTMRDRIEELIGLADAQEEHVLAALLCDAHDYVMRRLDGR